MDILFLKYSKNLPEELLQEEVGRFKYWVYGAKLAVRLSIVIIARRQQVVLTKAP